MIFEIPGNPIAKARHRTVRVKGQSLSYDPQSKEKELVRHRLKYLLKCACLSEDTQISKEALRLRFGDKYSLTIESYHQIPKSAPSALKMRIEGGLVEYHNVKPDADNIYKFYCDCGNGILYPDDSKIVEGSFKKTYSKNPRVVISIQRLE